MSDDRAPDRAAPPVMLVLGDIGRWVAKGRRAPPIELCYFASPQDLDRDLLDRVQPDFVVSALMGAGVDAMEIAERLVEYGFTGAFRAIAETLPNVGAVRTEIRAHAPGLDFDIFLLTE